MTNKPDESERPKAPQFSLLSLMLFVMVVAFYFGSAGWFLPSSIIQHKGILFTVLLRSFFIFTAYSCWLDVSWFSLICLICGFLIPVVMKEIETYMGDENIYSMKFLIASAWGFVYFPALAAISSIVHCKKVTGSVFPFVGERPKE